MNFFLISKLQLCSILSNLYLSEFSYRTYLNLGFIGVKHHIMLLKSPIFIYFWHFKSHSLVFWRKWLAFLSDNRFVSMLFCNPLDSSPVNVFIVKFGIFWNFYIGYLSIFINYFNYFFFFLFIIYWGSTCSFRILIFKSIINVFIDCRSTTANHSRYFCNINFFISLIFI